MTEKERFPENASKMSNSNTICREDVAGRDVELTMAEAAPGKGAVSASTARLPGKAREEDCYILHFRETEKHLVLNATNRKTLQRTFGNKTRDWVGKKITLYFDPKVKCPDGSRGGTRIRQTMPLEDVAMEPKHDPQTGEVIHG